MRSRFRSLRQKPISLAIAALLTPTLAGVAMAAPTGGVVTAGSASISQSGSITNINQASQKTIINWQGFSVGSGEAVNFNQPNASAIALNRVVGNEQSIINGALNANGQVFLVNSNGVLFGKGASVNVGGLVASTLNISDSDFLSGNYTFAGSGGSVINLGVITAKDGGYAALLGGSVSNQGVVVATKGTVAMQGAKKLRLNFNDDSLVGVTLDEGALNALVENKGAIIADGGKVILTAKAADDLLKSQVNNSGIVRARTLDDLTGNIEIHAYGGTANIDGTLDASAPVAGNGGFIETSGDSVKVTDSAVITTQAANGQNGNWLIDPNGFTIGVGGDMSGKALSNQLVNGNVTIASTSGSGTDGNINVNDTVSWSANTLTLNATNNIYVNSPGDVYHNTATMTATGTANFVANYGHVLDANGNPTATVSGAGNADGTPYGLYTALGADDGFSGKIGFTGTGTVMMNGESYTVINDIAGLAAAKSNPSGNYVLGSQISGLNSNTNPEAVGIGNDTTPFTGKFNGFGNLIYSPTLNGGTGLFGTIGAGGLVTNLAIGTYMGVSPAAGTHLTALGTLANVNRGTIINDFAGGGYSSINGNNAPIDYVGGLVGINYGLIAQSVYSGSVAVTAVGGGLVGLNSASGTIIDSAVRAKSNGTGTVTGNASATSVSYVGGFVGVNNGTIKTSYSGTAIQLNAAITNAIAGSFVGQNNGSIDQSYAQLDTLTSSPTSYSYYNFAAKLAGFVGDNSATGVITNAYTTSLYTTLTPNSQRWLAGFAYTNEGTITNAYSTAYSGNVSNNPRYGFVYSNTGTIANAYWSVNGTAAGLNVVSDSSTAVKLTSAQAPLFSSYVFDAAIAGDAWGASVSGYPVLRNLPIYVNLAWGTAGPSYGSATTNAGTLGLTVVGLQGGGGVVGTADTMAVATVAANGGYVDAGYQSASKVLSSSVYTKFKGYIGVTPKVITAMGVVADKVYDGNTIATLNSNVVNSGLVGLVGNQTLNVTYTDAVFADKNAGTGKTATVTFTVADGSNGGKASNYTISNQTTANITPKTLSVAATAADKTYDGLTDATVSVQLPGVVAGDSLSLAYDNAQFADRNAGQNKTVTVYGLALSGADLANYVLQGSSAQTTASITPRPLILYGSKAADGTDTITAQNLSAMNVVSGDWVVLSGSAKIASSTSGTQPITNVSALSVNNANYTLVGSVGTVVVGTQNLVLDHVASGTANIDVSVPKTTTVTTSDKAIIDWYRFSVAADEKITFVQPSASSIVLNRVTGSERSIIEGTLNANGRVFVLNSNGVLFSATSHVNVGALVASTLNLSDDNFNAGNYLFVGAGGNNSVVAAGDIVIVDGGFLALASGSGVSQTGTVTAHSGKAILASANSLSLTLNPGDNGLSGYTVGNLSGATAAAGAINLSGTGGLLETAGATVTATGLTLNTGSGGTWSWTQNGTVSIGSGGTLGADFVQTNLGLRNFNLTSMTGGINVNDAVSWSANTLSLNSANSIYVNAPMTATGSANFNGNYGTSLNADGSPNGLYTAFGTTNGVGNGTFSGKLDFSGSGSLTLNGHGYTLITSLSQLAALAATTSASSLGYYALGANLDASGASYAAPVVANLFGNLNGLGHTIDHLSNTGGGIIGNLGSTAYLQSKLSNIGLTNVVVTGPGMVTTNLGTIANSFVTGNITNGVGLVNYNGNTSVAYTGKIVNSYANVAVTATSGYAAGLVGTNGQSGTILGSYAYNDTGTLITATGTSYTGGLVGNNLGYVGSSWARGNIVGTNVSNVGGLIGSIANQAIVADGSYSKGSIVINCTNTACSSIGGLIGSVASGGTVVGTKDGSFGSTVNTIWSSVDVTVQDNNTSFNQLSSIGGLVGSNSGGTLAYVEAYGNVTLLPSTTLDSSIGGLVGSNSGIITYAKATGDVYAANAGSVGGLVGSNSSGSPIGISHTSSSGNVTGGSNVGGLVGYNGGNSNYYSYISDSTVSGSVTATGNNVGGIVGTNATGKISNVTSSANVRGVNYVGGIVGSNNSPGGNAMGGSISNATSTGNVTGINYVGGVAGQNGNIITGSTASGGVTGTDYVGGVVGNNSSATYSIVSDSSASGKISGQGVHVGDVAGNNLGGIVNTNYNDAEAAAAAQQAAADAAAQQAAVAADAQAAAEAVAEAAAQQAAAQFQARATSGGQIAANTAAAVQREVPGSTPAMVASAAPAAAPGAALESRVGFMDKASFSASIDSIEADGVVFELKDNAKPAGSDANKSTPAQ